MIIETERLSLRQYVLEDAAAVFELGSDSVVQRFTGDAAFTSIEQVRTMLGERPLAGYAKHGFGRWAVVSKVDGGIIGMAGLKFLPELHAVDLGYRLLPRYWGLGLATEASLACLRYGWETLRLSRILGLVHPANERSIRVLTRCGLTFEKMIVVESLPTAQYAIEAISNNLSNSGSSFLVRFVDVPMNDETGAKGQGQRAGQSMLSAGERPVGVKSANLEHVPDCLRLALAGAFGNAERLVDGGQFQVELLAAVVEEVHPADHPEDGAGPDLGFATEQGRRAFAGEDGGQSPAHHLVLVVQTGLAELIRQGDDGVVAGANLGREGRFYMGLHGESFQVSGLPFRSSLYRHWQGATRG